MPSLDSIQSIRDYYTSEFVHSVQGEVSETMLGIFTAKLHDRFDSVVHHYHKINGMPISRSEFCSTIKIGGQKDNLSEVYEGVYEEIDRITAEFTAEVYGLRDRIIKVLSGHYPDLNKTAIRSAGVGVFLDGDYSPFPSPEAVATAVMNVNVKGITEMNFPDVVHSLPVPNFSEKKRGECLAKLEAEGVNNSNTFFMRGLILLRSGMFDDILSENVALKSDREKLMYIAEFLGLNPLTASSEKVLVRSYLNQRGVFSISAFIKFSKIHADEGDVLPIYGDFRSLMNSFDDNPLPVVDSDGRMFIAHELSLDTDEVRQMAFYTQTLMSNIDVRGRSDYKVMKEEFLSSSFPPYSSPNEFANFVLNRDIHNNTFNNSDMRSLLRKLARFSEVNNADLTDYELGDGAIMESEEFDEVAMSEEAKEKLREEMDILTHKGVLSQLGIDDRYDLIFKGVRYYQNSGFSFFGGWKSFTKSVTGKAYRSVNEGVLNEVADELGFPPITKEGVKERVVSGLKEHGIYDKRMLMIRGPKAFMKIEIQPFGRGPKIVRALGFPTVRNMSMEELKAVADELGLPEFDQSYARESLEKFGISSIEEAEEKGVTWFKGRYFDDIGTAKAFSRYALGRPLGRGASITSPIFYQVIRECGLGHASEELRIP